MDSTHSHLPSIWLADFASKAEFDAQASALGGQLEVIAAIDDRMLQSRHPFDIKAWCAACPKKKVRPPADTPARFAQVFHESSAISLANIPPLVHPL